MLLDVLDRSIGVSGEYTDVCDWLAAAAEMKRMDKRSKIGILLTDAIINK